MIVKVNIRVTSFGMQLKTMWKLFRNSRRLEHHSVMVCPNVVVVFYLIWCEL